jgi:fatty-acyl-CoA synthase
MVAPRGAARRSPPRARQLTPLSPLSLSLSSARAQRQVYAYALGLLDGLGLRKGDKVAVWMTDELEHLVVRYAAALVGATAVEIDPRLGMEHVLAILAREECRALFASPRFGGQDRLAELARAFAAELAPAVAEGGALPLASKRLRSLKFLVCASAEFAEGVVRLRDLPVFGSDGSYDQDDVAAVQSFLAAADTLTVPYAPAAAGGAGFARGSPVSHAQLLASAAAAAKALALSGADVLVSTAPLGGALGLAAGPLAAAAAGAKLVLPAKAFDAAKTLAAASQQKASVLVALPEHVAPLAAELARGGAAYNLAALRAGVVLGASAGASLGKVALKGVTAF